MIIVNDILRQMSGLAQPQLTFLVILLVTIHVRRGRVTFRNLSHYCDDAEHTLSGKFRESFDRPVFHRRMLTMVLNPHPAWVSAHNTCFISKRGKQVFGLGLYLNGSTSRAEPSIREAHLLLSLIIDLCQL